MISWCDALLQVEREDVQETPWSSHWTMPHTSVMNVLKLCGCPPPPQVEREDVQEAMVFALDNADASGEVVDILYEALTLAETPVPIKVCVGSGRWRG